MTHSAIMAWSADNRVSKHQALATKAKAEAHITLNGDEYTGAFVVATPDAPVADWLVDPAAKTVTISPIPAPPVTADHVKAEAMGRILAIAPEWKQRNMTAAGVAMLSKLQAGGELTAEETDARAQYLAVWDQIEAIRAKSDLIEALDPIPQDYTADSHWL